MRRLILNDVQREVFGWGCAGTRGFLNAAVGAV